MIVFNLACAHSHAFEGWFSSAENFEKQQTYDLVSCPMCGDTHIEKDFSAPRLNQVRIWQPVACQSHD
ncbi:MAG TPA: DUF1178 family protein [Burkholderiales bacterium]